MKYRCEATTVAGFVPPLAVAYVGHGHFFYVTGEIPEGKDPCRVDQRIVEKYGIDIGRATRSRRKALGMANVHYIRYRREFVLLATPGRHDFFEKEGNFVRDAREAPIKFGGYAISFRAGHPHVRIEQRQYGDLKAYFAEVAVYRSKEWLEQQFRRLPFEPYAPVRGQLFGILREVNRRRGLAQFGLIPASNIRLRRRIVPPFKVVAWCNESKAML